MKNIKNNIIEWSAVIFIAILFILFKSSFLQVIQNSNKLFKYIIIGEVSFIGLLIIVSLLLYMSLNNSFVWDNAETEEEFDAPKKSFKQLNWILIIFGIIGV